MPLSADLSAAGLSMLKQFGQAISVTRDAVGAFTPATGVVTEATDTSYTGYGYPSAYNVSQIDGTIVRQDDTKLIFSSTVEPLVNDIFTVGSKVMSAVDVVKVSVQGVNVLYKVQLRQ